MILTAWVSVSLMNFTLARKLLPGLHIEPLSHCYKSPGLLQDLWIHGCLRPVRKEKSNMGGVQWWYEYVKYTDNSDLECFLGACCRAGMVVGSGDITSSDNRQRHCGRLLAASWTSSSLLLKYRWLLAKAYIFQILLQLGLVTWLRCGWWEVRWVEACLLL